MADVKINKIWLEGPSGGERGCSTLGKGDERGEVTVRSDCDGGLINYRNNLNI